MTHYTPPVQDMMFLLSHVTGLNEQKCDLQTAEAILDEAAKLASEVLAPLNAVGDQHGCKLDNKKVTTPPGFKEAYAQYRDSGWNAVPFSEEYGGQGLPWAIAFPVQEMWQGANMAFGLCPLLNQGAVEAIFSHGSEEQKQTYLEKLISGEWTGTMNLTEPAAGSDLGLIKTKAEKQEDGTYKISGQKIYITYGEHDFTENIIHLVLARSTDAPDDVKGISMFIVPKFFSNGTRNGANCIGLEHKLGIHASPTCTMEFDNAEGYLIGEEHQGLKYMFTMMNNARLSVGLQGVAIAEHAYQSALAYAKERVQGKSLETGERTAIENHPDVKRMLLSMRSQISAGRAITYEAAAALDQAHSGDEAAQNRANMLTPIVKSWCTDMACEVTSTGIQIYGGMGYVEETGAAQFMRDARILPIYEGTNGIQAQDLIFRKILRDEGKAFKHFIDHYQARIPKEHSDIFKDLFLELENALTAFSSWASEKNLSAPAFSAAPFLNGLAILLGGIMLCISAHAAKNLSDKNFQLEKEENWRFYKAFILDQAKFYFQSSARTF